MSNKKQTAVEFISKGLFDILQEAEDNNIFEIGTQNFKRYVEMFENQAKELEKQDMENKAIHFAEWLTNKHTLELMRLYEHFEEQFYNETFNK